MRHLLLKSLRDLRQRWLSFVSCGAMIAVAVLLFVAFMAASTNLDESCRYAYERLKFLDFSIALRRAPQSAVERVAALPGVESAVGRQTVGIRLFLPSGDYVPGRAISLSHERQPAVNQLHLDQGRYLLKRRGEILMERRFAQAHGYGLSSPVRVESHGVQRQFTLVGLVSSPEYIWVAAGPQDPRPAARKFAVLFISQADAISMSGDDSINEVHVRVRDQGQRDVLMEQARRCLGDYAAEAPMSREEQPSNALLIRDRRAFATLAVMFPSFFLLLGSLILISTLTQLIAQQRLQIGVLMSQGFSSGNLMSHFLLTSVFIGGAAGLTGALAGWGLGELCTRFYTLSLGIPFVTTRVPWAWMLAAVTGAISVSAIGGWRGVSRLVYLNPAEVLRADFTPQQRTLRLESWFPPLRRAPYLLRLPLRNLFRQPTRTLALVLAIALAVIQMVTALMSLDSQRETLDFYFRAVNRYDLQINLRMTSPASLPPIARWPGVIRVEGFLGWKARLILGDTTLARKVWGIPPNSELVRLYDRNRHPIKPTERSPLLLGSIHMRELSAHPGDIVQLRSNSPRTDESVTPYGVGAELFEPVALAPMVLLSKLQAQCSEIENAPRDVINMLMLRVSPEYQDAVRRRLFTCPEVVSVVTLADTRADVTDLLKMLNAYLALMIGGSCLLAVALLVGSSAMNIMERSRELATLSVLGVSDQTLVGILMLETLIAWLLGLALGLPTGVWAGNWMLAHYGSDLMDLTLSVSPPTLVGTAAGSLVVCLGATAASLRRVLRIPLTAATQRSD